MSASPSVSIWWQAVGLHQVRAAQAGLGGRAGSCRHAAGRRGRSLAAGGPRAHPAPEPAAGLCCHVNRRGHRISRYQQAPVPSVAPKLDLG